MGRIFALFLTILSLYTTTVVADDNCTPGTEDCGCRTTGNACNSGLYCNPELEPHTCQLCDDGRYGTGTNSQCSGACTKLDGATFTSAGATADDCNWTLTCAADECWNGTECAELKQNQVCTNNDNITGRGDTADDTQTRIAYEIVLKDSDTQTRKFYARKNGNSWQVAIKEHGEYGASITISLPDSNDGKTFSDYCQKDQGQNKICLGATLKDKQLTIDASKLPAETDIQENNQFFATWTCKIAIHYPGNREDISEPDDDGKVTLWTGSFEPCSGTYYQWLINGNKYDLGAKVAFLCSTDPYEAKLSGPTDCDTGYYCTGNCQRHKCPFGTTTQETSSTSKDQCGTDFTKTIFCDTTGGCFSLPAGFLQGGPLFDYKNAN